MFFKRKPKQLTEEEYQAEYRRLLRELNGQFAVGDAPWDQVIHSMGVIDREMNGNGGVNWTETGYTEFLDALRQHLSAETRFSSEQLAKIQWSLDEITACGHELVERGESARSATEAVDYLILRVVDWGRWNPDRVIMTDFDTISTETWKVRLPVDWMEQKSATDGSVYFESADTRKGVYFSTWRFNDDPRSPREILESFRRVELRGLDEMEGRTWQRMDDWCTHSPSLTLGVDCLDREHSYRIVCHLIIRLPWLVRSSFHDYDCRDYAASREFFCPIIQSLEIHHEDA